MDCEPEMNIRRKSCTCRARRMNHGQQGHNRTVGFPSKSGAESVLQQIGEFAVPEANQGVGVDAQHFYAVDNQAIGKYDKTTGKLVKKWQGDKKGPFLHLDSAMVMDGKIYAAHSNYPD